MLFIMAITRTFVSSAITAIQDCFRTECSNAVICSLPSYDPVKRPLVAPRMRSFACDRFHMSAARYVPMDT